MRLAAVPLLVGTLLLPLLLVVPTAAAETAEQVVQPGANLERSLNLSAGQSITYTYNARLTAGSGSPASVDFNVHKHDAAGVETLREIPASSTGTGCIDVPAAGEYFLMWTNPGTTAVRVSFTYNANPGGCPTAAADTPVPPLAAVAALGAAAVLLARRR